MQADLLSPALFTVDCDRDGDGAQTMVRLRGEVDVCAVPELRAAAAGCRSAGRVCLDLAAVSFLDSSGALALCDLAAGVRAGGGQIVVDNLSPAAARIFALLGIAAL